MSASRQVWIAHSAEDPISSVCHAFEQSLYDEAKVINDSGFYLGAIREGTDPGELATQCISSAHLVIALLTPDTDEEQVVGQLRQARILGKPVIALFFWAKGERQPSRIPGPELRALLSGVPHLYVKTSGLVDQLRQALTSGFTDLNGRTSLDPVDEPTDYDVFISKRSLDLAAARTVSDYLGHEGRRTFFSEESLLESGSTDYMTVIDAALESAPNLVLVATKAEYVTTGWVEAEWRTFINEKRSERKEGNLVSVVGGDLQPSDLPIALRQFEVIPLSESTLPRLLAYV